MNKPKFLPLEANTEDSSLQVVFLLRFYLSYALGVP
jgi:hypothetical protein